MSHLSKNRSGNHGVRIQGPGDGEKLTSYKEGGGEGWEEEEKALKSILHSREGGELKVN